MDREKYVIYGTDNEEHVINLTQQELKTIKRFLTLVDDDNYGIELIDDYMARNFDELSFFD